MNKITTRWIKSVIIALLMFTHGLGLAVDADSETQSPSKKAWVFNQQSLNSLKANDLAQAEAVKPDQVIEVNPAALNESATKPEQQASAKKGIVEARLLNRQLEQQLAKLQKTRQTRDAYSLQLAEDYFGYGKLLSASGQNEEAISAFTDALHIQKVNHGLYAVEQRPALRELFNIYYEQGRAEEFEEALDRIIWIETRNEGVSDDISFNMLLKVGNDYIDRFMQKPFASQSSVENLISAKQHLTNAVRLHKSKPLTQLVMPYGELALISVLESRLQGTVEGITSVQNSRRLRQPSTTDRQFAISSYLANSYSRGMAALIGYLNKARQEGNAEHQLKALLALGDYNLMLERSARSLTFYEAAVEILQTVGEEYELGVFFDQPVALPAFDYASESRAKEPRRPHIDVPLLFTVSPRGRVIGVENVAELDETYQPYLRRAHRIARRMKFRPIYSQGEFAQASKFASSARVFKKQSDLEVEKQTENKASQ